MYLLKIFFQSELVNLTKKNPVSIKVPRTSFKSIIEGVGIPHTEIGILIFNNENVNISNIITEDGILLVYPKKSEAIKGEARFILDVHLGTLAKYLRMLGFDTLYKNDYEDREIVDIALRESRVILTRDRGILKRASIKHGYLIRSFCPREQLDEVLTKYQLYEKIRPLTRCLKCNSEIVLVAKEEILERIPPKSRKNFDEFYVCEKCHKIYWKGSHYDRFKKIIEDVSEKNKKY